MILLRPDTARLVTASTWYEQSYFLSITPIADDFSSDQFFDNAATDFLTAATNFSDQANILLPKHV